MSLTDTINSKALSDIISGGTRVTAVKTTSGSQSNVIVRAVTGFQKVALHGFTVSSDAATTITLKLGSVTIYTIYLDANSSFSPNIPWINPPLGGKGKNLTISSTAGNVSISANVAMIDIAPTLS